MATNFKFLGFSNFVHMFQFWRNVWNIFKFTALKFDVQGCPNISVCYLTWYHLSYINKTGSFIRILHLLVYHSLSLTQIMIRCIYNCFLYKQLRNNVKKYWTCNISVSFTAWIIEMVVYNLWIPKMPHFSIARCVRSLYSTLEITSSCKYILVPVLSLIFSIRE